MSIPVTTEFLEKKNRYAIAMIDNNILHGLFTFKKIIKHMMYSLD